MERTGDGLKRVLDVLLSSGMLLVLGPGLLLVGLAVRVDSRGPAVYRGRRVGKDGRPFEQLKFRSMVADADRRGGPCTAVSDPRITRVGRWLRRYKVDELPQLLNVLRGEMSLVGPRPEVDAYVARLGTVDPEVLAVRPGITDWATLWNADEEAFLGRQPMAPEAAYERYVWPTKVRLQLEYVRSRSFWADAEILVATVARLLGVPLRCRGLERALERIKSEDPALVTDLERCT